jgi:hypothetical protein
MKIGVGRIVRGSFSTQGETEFTLRILPTHADVQLGGETIGKRWIGSIAELSFVGDGRLTSALITEYNNAAAYRAGASLGTNSDVPCDIHWNDGSNTTRLQASFFSRLGAIVGHPERGIVEAHTITGIVATGKAFTEASSFVDDAVGASTFADSGFLTSAILRQLYTCAMATGPTGFTSFQFQDGFRFEVNLNTRPVLFQGVVRDFRFQGIEAMLSGIPVEPTFAQALAAMKASGSGAVPGREEAANAFSFTATGDVTSTAHITIPLCSVIRTQQESSSIKLRLGDTGFLASRGFEADGTRKALFTIA